MAVLSIFMHRSTFLLRINDRSGAATFVRSLLMKTRKGLARDVVQTSATYSSHVHDVMDLIKVTAPTAVFSNFQTLIFNKLDHKSIQKRPYCSFRPITVHRPCSASSLVVPINSQQHTIVTHTLRSPLIASSIQLSHTRCGPL